MRLREQHDLRYAQQEGRVLNSQIVNLNQHRFSSSTQATKPTICHCQPVSPHFLPLDEAQVTSFLDNFGKHETLHGLIWYHRDTTWNSLMTLGRRTFWNFWLPSFSLPLLGWMLAWWSFYALLISCSFFFFLLSWGINGGLCLLIFFYHGMMDELGSAVS